MAWQALAFRAPDHYSLNMTCHAHGWMDLAPFRWDDERHTISFALLLGRQSADIEACQRNNTIEAVVTSKRTIDAESRDRVARAIVRSLALDVDTTELLGVAAQAGTEYAELVMQGAGRLLRGTTLWEDAAKTLFTTNCSWILTRRMAATACSGRFCPTTPSGAFPFPPPDRIAQLTPGDIAKHMPVGYRAPFLHSLAERFCEDGYVIPEEALLCGESIRKAAQSWRGFGPYAASHVAVLLGQFDLIPIDSEVDSYVRSTHRTCASPAFLARRYRHWGKLCWWGYKFDRMLQHRNGIGG